MKLHTKQLFVTMKKELQLDDIHINNNQFHNPVSQETFDSLPRIYGTIKHRIYSNKLKFYEMVDQKFRRNRDQSSKETQFARKKSSKKVRTQKSQSKAETEKIQELRLSLSKQNFNKQTNKELIKHKKLKEQIEQAKVFSLKKKIYSDHESVHKVKFNHHLLHPVSYSSAKHGGRPETLTELTDDKINKTVSVHSPLVNLYKKKNQKVIFNSCEQYIRQETLEDDSYENSPKQHYIPKQLLRNLKLKKEAEEQQSIDSLSKRNPTSPIRKHPSSPKKKISSSEKKNIKSSNKKIKMEMSPGSQAKKNQNTTEFSRRITENSFERMSKLIPVGQNKKFIIPSKGQYKDLLKNYHPMNSSFHINGLIEKQNFQIIQSQKSVYFGEFTEQMHGYGIWITAEFIFQGQFSKGQMLKGSQMNYDGIYTGNYCNNLREGKGRFEWNNGEIYEGEWKAGRKHGFGIWRSYNGDSYEGQWANGRQEGLGTRKHKNNIYKGELLNSLKHGKGEEYFQNGDHYRGAYQHGKPHGFGRYDWRDGSYYEGEFANGYREGKGELHEKNGSIYKGNSLGLFRRDFKHGMGQQIQQSGYKISGIFQNGELLQPERQL